MPRSMPRSRWWPTRRVRAERAGGRGHTAVDERAARQLSQREKSQRATYTVNNDGTVDRLRDQLSAIIERLAS